MNNQPDLFDMSGMPARTMGARSFQPKATPSGCARVLLRCSKKGCKFCKAADIAQEIKEGTWGGRYTVLDAVALARFKTDTKCPTHPNAYLESATVQGTHSDAQKCDPRCTSAIGPDCSCQCGGANHGCSWL